MKPHCPDTKTSTKTWKLEKTIQTVTRDKTKSRFCDRRVAGTQLVHVLRDPQRTINAMAEVDSFLPTGLLQISEPDIDERPFLPTDLLFDSGPPIAEKFREEDRFSVQLENDGMFW